MLPLQIAEQQPQAVRAAHSRCSGAPRPRAATQPRQQRPLRQLAGTNIISSSVCCCSSRSSSSSVALLPQAGLAAAAGGRGQPAPPAAAATAAAGAAASSSRPRRRGAARCRAGSSPPPDPWRQGTGVATQWGGGGDGTGSAPGSPLGSMDAWDAAAPPGPLGGTPQYEQTDWGWGPSGNEDWDPADGLGPEQLAAMEADYLDQLARRRTAQEPPRDKWLTPLLDWQSIYGAFDPDQSRTEESMADEALTNKEESREAAAFVGRLLAVPLLTGALISRAITQPVLSFSLQNNPDAFAMTERQKVEGATALHMEETRVRMMVALGQAPPLDDDGMLRHLHEYALEVQEEERHKNEANLMTLVSDSISGAVFFALFARDTDGRAALFCTIGRLFEGLSDIAKAVLIILAADTLLGYHSEEGWTGFLDLVLGHYGIEVEEENIVLFVGVIPIAIDVLFKYWIFIGLNRISPGAVVTIKQLDRH